MIQNTQKNGFFTCGIIVVGGFIFAKLFTRLNKHKSSTQLIISQNQQQNLSIEDLVKKYGKEFNQSKYMENIIPRSFQNEEQLEKITNNLYYTKKNSNLSSLSKALSQPIWDLLDRGGKRWRPILCMLVAEIFNHKRNQIYDIASLCQIVHNGTLMIDDIEDQSFLRRNKKCVHLIYGVDISLNAGNFMYFAPFNYILKNSNYTAEQKVKMGEIFIQEMTNLHLGQGWDILWHNINKLQGAYPTQNDYFQMTSHKTGVLARLSSRLVCVALNTDQQLTNVISRLAETMGIVFQIQDDLLNLEGEQYIKTKGYSGEDIHEGKLTLMVIYTLQRSEKQKCNRLIQILTKKTEDEGQIKQAITILRESGSFQYAKKTMQSLILNAWQQAQSKLPNNKYTKYLEQLAYFNITRKM